MRASLQRTMQTGKRVKPPPFKRPRKNPRLIPQVCPVHGIPMVIRRTTEGARYHYCTEPGCRESKTTAR